MRSVIVFSLLLLSGLVHGQDRILLANDKFTPEKSVWDYSENEVVDGRIYRLIQSPLLKLNKTVAGIHTMEYVPANTFYSSIEVSRLNEAKTFLAGSGNYVMPVKPEWKLSQALLENNIPDHIWRGVDQIEVWMKIYRDVPESIFLEELNAAGLQVRDTKPELYLYSVIISPDAIISWASKPYIVRMEEYRAPDVSLNFYSRASHRIDYIQNPNVMPQTFSGSGVAVGVGDDGSVNHLDYNDRILQNVPNINQGDHADHVTGTLAGAGIVEPTAKGNAPDASLVMSFFSANLNNAPTDYDQYGVRLISGSYGPFGGCSSTSPYSSTSVQVDNLPLSRPTVTGLWSAGNEAGSNCSPVGSPWGTMGGDYSRAKNQIAVASAQRNNSISGFSSRGPTPDGRLKPDITGLGSGVYSCTDQPLNNSYTVKSGTSMSCPGVAGGVATMYEAYRHYNNDKDPLASTVKAVLLNTAQDLGNPGPDFTFGYGRANLYRAHKVIEAGTIIVDSISSGINTHTIALPANGTVTEVRVLLCWTDTVGNPNAARILVNDLDLTVQQGANSYQPWVLDPTWSVSNLTSNAERARDSLNNVEQVTFTNPGTGNLTIEVDGSGVVTSKQVYSIAYEFVMDSMVLVNPAGGESYQPGTQVMISWVAGESPATFGLEYSLDSGATWASISNNLSSDRRDRLWQMPLISTNKGLIRLTRAGDTATIAKTFTIVGEVLNLTAVSSCPDSTLTLAWDSVFEASQYVVYKYMAGRMDSIGLATDTFFVVSGADFQSIDEWYSVAPMLGDRIGIRSDAYNKPPGIFNCTLTDDIDIETMSSPSSYGMPDCYPVIGVPVRINLVNRGVNDASNFVVSYRLNGAAAVSDTVKDTIAPGAHYIHEFNNSGINLQPQTNYDFVFSVDYLFDRNPFNDTLEVRTRLVSSQQFSVPYLNDFENFNTCGTNSNCGQTQCNLSDGWNNLSNLHIDDHDWRVISGPSPSSGTGPNTDFIPGSATGQYLYLEASSGCDSSEAILLSPCLLIDTSTVLPTIEYAYHMLGSNMGKLSVDLITEDGEVINVVPVVSGNQGNAWITKQIDMQPYRGQVVSVRFRGKTGNNYLSDLALDYFNLFDASVTAPTAGFTAQFDNTGCIGDSWTFQDNSSGSIDNYNWNFGPNAVPSTATGPGPHNVIFSSRGYNQVQLQVSNAGGLNIKADSVLVLDVPGGFFNYAQNSNIITFTDVSSFSPNAWSWDFGDGNTSSQQNPVHTYAALGTYTVVLMVTNDCGTDDYERKITVNWISTPEQVLAEQIKVFPNPATDLINVEIPEQLESCQLVLSDLSGKQLQRVEVSGSSKTSSLNIEGLSEGVYILGIEKDGKVLRNMRIVKDNAF